MVRKGMIVIAGCEMRLLNRNPASLYEGVLGACPFVVVSYPKRPFSLRWCDSHFHPSNTHCTSHYNITKGDRLRKPRHLGILGLRI